MPYKTTEISINCRDGARTVSAVWCGAHLAVHRPIKDGAPDTRPNTWAITHLPTGLSASGTFNGSVRRAISLAKLWDTTFADITSTGTAKGWPWAQAWARDLEIAQNETFREPNGPVAPTLESARTASDLQTAVYRAMGYQPLDDSEAAEQYPAAITKKQTGSGAVRRNNETGELQFWWLPRGGNYQFGSAMELAGWYPVPSMGDIEAWCLGDIAETPCGDSVEPDHPDAWPRLLGAL